jgi:hypothetical protein
MLFKPRFFSRIASALLLLTMSSISFAQQDACVALIQHGIYASHVTQTSAQSYQEFRSNFCSWYSQYRESHSGGSADIKIPIVDIPIGISGSMTYSEADAMRSAICSAVASQAANSQTFLDASRYIDPNGAAAFASCVTAQSGGLKIQTNINDDETSAVIGIAYQAPFGAGPATVQRVDTLGWTCPKPGNGGTDLTDIVARRNALTNNQFSIVCHRDILAAPVTEGGIQIVAHAATINIGTTAGSFIQQFRPKIFKDPLADTAKVLASYPKGTILPFAGRLDSIPQGWHLCDGHDGTVNLLNRAPFGATQDSEIGKTDGSLTHHHSFSGRTQRPDGVDNVHVHQQGNDPLTVKGVDHTHAFSGTTADESNLPPITRIYFIQKID